jgi:hypothetical protein
VLNGSLSYHYSERDAAVFTNSTRPGTELVSPVNSADRERHRLRATLDWAPTERIDAQFAFEASKDNYGTGTRSHGLDEGSATLASIDLNYRMSDDWQVTGWYSRNVNSASFVNLAPRDQNTTSTLLREQDDIGEAFGLNLNGKVAAKTRVGAELSLSKDRTLFEQAGNPGSAPAAAAYAPNIVSRATKLRLFVNQEVKKNAELRFDFVREQWSSNDWQWTYQDGRAWQAGTATDGTAVIAPGQQDSKLVSARYIYRFQ